MTLTPKGRPNFVLVFSDQQRFDAVGCNGNTFISTPHIDRLARDGARFTQACTPWPVCTPTRATLWTGVLPHKHGVVSNTYGEPNLLRDVAMVKTTLFDLLRVVGYRSGYFGKWHLGEADPELFDVWSGFNSAGGHWVDGQVDGQYKPDLQTDAAIAFLEDRSAEPDVPFILVQSYYPPHQPYSAPKHYMDRYRSMGVPFPGYFAGVEAIDDNLGRLLDAMDRLELADQTVVVYFSDHGETFNYRRESRNKFVCYEEAIRVPLVVRWPGKVQAGLVLDSLVGLEDLFATVISLSGAAEPEHGQHGRDLTPLLTLGRTVPWRQEYYVENVTFGGLSGLNVLPGREQRAIRTTRWKLILSDDGTGELYDLLNDPEEELDIYLTPRPDPHGRFERIPSQAQVILELAERLERCARQVDDNTGIALAAAAQVSALQRLAKVTT